jgi:hypothetical protein
LVRIQLAEVGEDPMGVLKSGLIESVVFTGKLIVKHHKD